MNVAGQERSLESTGSGVKDDTPGDKERSKTVVNTGKSFNSSGTSKQKHGSHNDVGSEGEEKERLVGGAAPSSVDDLANGVSRRSNFLQGDSKDSEKEDLNSSTRCIPERTRDTISPGNVGRLKKSRGPGPLADNNTSRETGFNHTTSGVETLTGDFFSTAEVLFHHHQARGDHGEEGTESKNDNVANSLAERRRTSEETILSLIFQEWGEVIAEGDVIGVRKRRHGQIVPFEIRS
mmetsp:Transcript_16820/g.27923  ORF Transcript_16820/g.27923 Transcript_16820/m.27923 type:complete len:236 (+) Transcript_16820:1635-2342(+)